MSVKIQTTELPKHVAFIATIENLFGEGMIEVRAIKRFWDRGMTAAQYHKGARVYGAIDALAPELAALEPFTTYAIPLKPETADDKVRAAMWSAWKRETTREASQRLLAVLTEIAKDEKIAVPLGTPRFSHKAGCSCGCSPGFILQEPARTTYAEYGSVMVDFHLDIIPDPAALDAMRAALAAN